MAIVSTETAVMRATPTPPTRTRPLRDGGFTLLEVMVVVLVIGILLAVGIPTYLGARDRAHDRAAQSTLNVALTTALVMEMEHGTFWPGGVPTAELNALEPSLVFGHYNYRPEAGGNGVGLRFDVPADEIYLATLSESGRCLFIRYSHATGARYGGYDDGADDCRAGLYPRAAPWSDTW